MFVGLKQVHIKKNKWKCLRNCNNSQFSPQNYMCHLIKQLMTFHFGGHWFINPLEVINHSVHLMKSHWIGLKYNYCRGRMVVGFTTIYAISVYHHWRCDFESRSGEMYSKQQYVIKFVSDLRRSVVFSGYSGFLHQ